MSRTVTLRQSREDKSVKFLEFIKLYSKDKNQLCCFFEGDDAKYYGVRIENLKPGRSWSPINCRGKKMVLDLFELLSKHADYSKASTAFFVDRDFDPPLSDNIRSRVYETPCYSVENFYTSVECFRRILQSEFGITDGIEDGSVLQKCCEIYEDTQRQSHDALTELNAWIWVQRNHNKTGGAMNLREIRLDRFISVDLGKVSKLYTVADLQVIFPHTPAADAALLAAKTTEFQELDRRRIFRGKYELEVLRLVLLRLIVDYRSDSPKVFPQRGTVKILLSRENLISELSQYADTPACLRDYLNSLN